MSGQTSIDRRPYGGKSDEQGGMPKLGVRYDEYVSVNHTGGRQTSTHRVLSNRHAIAPNQVNFNTGRGHRLDQLQILYV